MAAQSLSALPSSLSVPRGQLGCRRKSGWFAVTVLLGAFLVFQVQPVISKCVLPWFGGTPAVWSTCMVFFQVLLFAGYAYAHLLRTFCRPQQQAWIHIALLGAAVLVLPIEPADSWKPTGSESPTLYLLWMLAAHVGLPYFVLASTGPLVQAWLSYQDGSDRVYRLYALSNAGSLSALLSYPFVVEPFLSVTHQTFGWSLLFCGFVLIQGLLAIGLLRVESQPAEPAIAVRSHGGEVIHGWRRIAWVLLPALASAMLLVTTQHVCQDVAVIPFLWILPLSLYLLSFIICFDSPQWYRPRLIALGTLVAVIGTQAQAVLPDSFDLLADIVSYMLTLFGVCLLAHGEVARIKPPPALLTQYYLLLSAGGAIGGLLVAIVCPLIFDTHFELSVMMAVVTAGAFLMLFVCRDWRGAHYDWSAVQRLKYAAVALILLPLAAGSVSVSPDTIAMDRNFFGLLKVERTAVGIRLVHGSTIHGMQLHGQRSQRPTTYYSQVSGVGRTLLALQDAKPQLQVGVVGLGCGVLATYGRAGDRFDLIDINPAVMEIANQHFTFLRDSKADIMSHLGDGRLVLERLTTARFDVLVLDAFSSDAIPAHLLTREAFALYVRRLKTDGVLAVHVSNQHLDLAPLVYRLGQDAGLSSRLVRSPGSPEQGIEAALWVVVAAPRHPVWAHPQLAVAEVPSAAEIEAGPLWTDQHHDLVRVLRFW